jgi:hypothetical protein
MRSQIIHLGLGLPQCVAKLAKACPAKILNGKYAHRRSFSLMQASVTMSANRN